MIHLMQPENERRTGHEQAWYRAQQLIQVGLYQKMSTSRKSLVPQIIFFEDSNCNFWKFFNKCLFIQTWKLECKHRQWHRRCRPKDIVMWCSFWLHPNTTRCLAISPANSTSHCWCMLDFKYYTWNYDWPEWSFAGCILVEGVKA